METAIRSGRGLLRWCDEWLVCLDWFICLVWFVCLVWFGWLVGLVGWLVGLQKAAGWSLVRELVCETLFKEGFMKDVQRTYQGLASNVSSECSKRAVNLQQTCQGRVIHCVAKAVGVRPIDESSEREHRRVKELYKRVTDQTPRRKAKHGNARKRSRLSAVGFEPTSANTVELESTPLDRSGTLTITYALPTQIYTRPITNHH